MTITPMAPASLRARTWVRLLILAVIMGLVLFLCAGTIRYWQGWIYLGLFVGLSAVISEDLMHRDPALLERRLTGGPTAEPRPVQRLIMLLASIAFASLLIVPALDVRFGWSHVPTGLVILGDILFFTGFGFIGRVYRENTYTASTVKVEEGQRVISTGPYAVVRHPMYASAMLYLIGTPLALGSYWGYVALVVFAPVLIWRLLDEERLLSRELSGYTEYRQRVRFRLIPGVW
jgi:protein-S-isoprenylcysteine O-methyltransferase Ste14